MGDSYSVQADTCTCEAAGADDDNPLHFFDELEISSCENNEYDADDLTLEELEFDKKNSIFHDLGESENENENIFGEDGSEPLSPNPNLSDNNDANLSPDGNGNISNYSASVKIKSALKGSREKEGKTLNPNFHVKWAPDVYDPPITSDDHTLKRVPYKPRVKYAKKEYSKQKPGKSKSSHGKSKNSHSSSKINDPRMIRLIARHEKSLSKFEELNGPDKINLRKKTNEIDKINSNKKTNEIKFGSIYCREMVSSRLHLPLAEAS